MIRPILFLLMFAECVLYFAPASVEAAESLQQRVTASVALLDGAEDRFRSLDPEWYESTRLALQEETQRVGQWLDSQGEEYAAAWKKHLRWPLLTSNLGEASEVNLAELALVRRWLFSNRKGLETPYFAELRQRIEAHLDAVFVAVQPDLPRQFRVQVELAREQILALADGPTDARAAALGRTLGWLERTRQLSVETAEIRLLLSSPNAQVFVAKPLIDRMIGLLATDIKQTLPVSDSVTVQNGSLFGRSRTAKVHGIAHTHGQIHLEIEANQKWADLQLVYLGEVESHCRAIIGPVTVAMQTLGPVRAITPIQISLQGIELLSTEVFPQVQTRVMNVSARSNLIRRLGSRRVHEPESLGQMNSRAREKTSTLIQEEMDERVNTAFEEIRAELQKTQASMDSFQDVLAPVTREGATVRLDGIQSTAEGITLNVRSQRREQIGAVNRCSVGGSADVQVRLHVSFFNNMAEAIMAGKTFTDEYFMKYSRVLQVELPPALMVHSRSVRWAIVAAKPRPLEITIPAPNHFRIELRMQQVEIGDEQFTCPTIAAINYALVQNEYGDTFLARQGDIELDSPMPTPSREFLIQKLQAFFAPILNGGGVALPEGGSLGRLRGLKPHGVIANNDWLTLGVDVPTEVLEQWIPLAK